MLRPQQDRPGVLALLARLAKHVTPTRRLEFLQVIALTLASSVSEVVSLAAVVPFTAVLTQPDRILRQHSLTGALNRLGVVDIKQIVLLLSIAFGLAAIASGWIRLALLRKGLRLANAVGADLGVEVYRRTLFQPYAVHIARNSSEIISGITQKIAATTGILVSSVAVISSSTLTIAIVLTLLAIDPTIAVIAFITFGSSYTAVALKTRKRLSRNSEHISREHNTVLKALQEGLGGIRDVLLDGTQSTYCNVYGQAIEKQQRANGENSYIAQAPRYAMESLGLVLVSAAGAISSRSQAGIEAALPTLAALGLGAQRLLPLIQQLYGNWAAIAGSHAALGDVVDLLEQTLPQETGELKASQLQLTKQIDLVKLQFRYSSTGPWILKELSLTIPKGSRIGIVGKTGSGKSTLLDLLLALLEPSAGQIYIDGIPLEGPIRRSWQTSIAHVPQSIFLLDDSIAANIAFGVPTREVDMTRVREAAKRAQISEFIDSQSDGYRANVGERGVRLSGGQRQRIGIARALYKKAQVLILDEATSALDDRTEQELMSTIQRLGDDITVLTVAHRISSLRHCQSIVELNDGHLTNHGSYTQFIATHAPTDVETEATLS